MSTTRRRRRRSGFPMTLTLLGAAGVLAVSAWVADRNEWIDIPLFSEVLAAEEEPEGPGEGEVLVPLASIEIPAYTKLNRDHFLRPGTLELASQILPEENVEAAGLVIDLSELIGRVTARTKRAGYAFRPTDLLPDGTRPGLVGGIPAGMRGLRIEAELIRGIAGLSAGDRFDIMSAQALDAPRNQSSSIGLSGVFAPQAQAALNGPKPRASVQVLVQNGVVVEPLATRQVPVSSASLTQGLTVRTKPVQELVVAVRPEEVAPLMESLALEAQLTCVPRSGHPEDPLDSVTPALERSEEDSNLTAAGLFNTKSGPLTLVDRIDGDERAIVPVPVGGGTDGR